MEDALKEYGEKKPATIDPELISTLSLNKRLFRNSQHITANEFKKAYGREVWNSYYKFAFVRNPIDRLLSYFLTHKGRLNGLDDFDDYILHLDKIADHRRMTSPCFDWLSDEDGQLLDIDFIGKLENIGDDFRKICRELGIDAKLTHKNKTKKGAVQTLSYYNQKSLEEVRTKFQRDFTTFKYGP